MAQIFKVGGCVRDRFLGVDSKDIDFTFVCENSKTVEEGWQEMRDWMTIRGFEIFLETPDCFTIRAKFPSEDKFPAFGKFEGMVADFVMARKEMGYIEGTRRPILELGTLEDDLIRRDFTVNALAETLTGEIIDLFGGIRDIQLKQLVTPLDPKITMMDDPLRVLRALRFSITKNFTINHTIWDAMSQHEILEKLKSTVSGERIREEVMKMMKHDTPESIKLLMDVDRHHIPGFIDLVFNNGLWLKPTFEKR